MENQMGRDVEKILSSRNLTANFQPIIDLQCGRLFGYEGLIRGPQGTPLESPVHLFGHAREAGCLAQLELLCVRIIWDRFTALDLPGRLFLNLSLPMLRLRDENGLSTLAYLKRIGVEPHRVAIELSETQTLSCYRRARRLTTMYRRQGYAFGIDDLGAGFSSLRLWLELEPEYVKLDIAFVRGIDADQRRQTFLRSIQQLACAYSTPVIVEGIETEAEYRTVRDLGLPLGQGYYLGRPSPCPAPDVRLTCD